MLRVMLISIVGMAIPFFSAIFLGQSLFGSGDWNTVQTLIFLFILLCLYVLEWVLFILKPPRWLLNLWYGFSKSKDASGKKD